MATPPSKKLKLSQGTSVATCEEIEFPSISEQASRILQNRPNIDGNIDVAIKLLRDGNTIPFIARYRRVQTGGINEDDLRKIQREMGLIDKTENKRKSVWKTALKTNVEREILNAIKNAFTLESLDTIKESFSPSEGKKSKYQIAVEKGLTPLGLAIIADNYSQIQMEIKKLAKSCDRQDEVIDGGITIASEIIFLDADQEELSTLNRLVDLVSKDKKDTEKKYSIYHCFRQNLSRLQSYQVLAILRGEKEKALKVSFASVRDQLSPTPNCNDDGISKMLDSTLYKLPNGWFRGHKKVVMPKTAEKLEAWKRARARLRKLCERMWRRQIKEMAEEGAIAVFSSNLHQKMLTPPLRYWVSASDAKRLDHCDDDMRVIALDPGFAHGTKVAIVKISDGTVLNTLTLNMNRSETAVTVLRSVIWRDKDMCNSVVIAVGNGHGSQNAVQIVKEAIGAESKQFENIIYVDETGASIYSATDLAKKELPDMDINHRSAVSLARRVIDPLSELCKIEPESLGVGQYQHDVDKNTLALELKNCVESCVANVGVDLSTCSESLLKYVPGIGPARAKKIIEHREKGNHMEVGGKKRKKTGLLSKSDICNIPGIGEKVLKQAAGFIYISHAPKLVDRIAHIHPETIPIIEFLQQNFGGETLPNLKLEDEFHVAQIMSFIENYSEGINQNRSFASVKKSKTSKRSLDDDSDKDIDKPNSSQDSTLDCFNIEIVKDIVKELKGEVEDVRRSQPTPLKIDLDKKQKTAADVKAGDIFYGTVKNVVEFGAFVDINVGQDGLIHKKRLGGNANSLRVNQTLKVKVLEKTLKGKKYLIGLAPA